MTVTLYNSVIKNGACGPGACSHRIIDHLVEVCDGDVVALKLKGFTDPPKADKASPRRSARAFVEETPPEDEGERKSASGEKEDED